MQPFWITFVDGSKACCEGQSVLDAVEIAEAVSGNKVAPAPGIKEPRKWIDTDWQVQRLPYPATPIIWQLDHPAHGKCPTFCSSPSKCAGRGACPQNYACSE
jgi:hypothetical protein